MEQIANYMATLGRIAKETRCRIDGVGCTIDPTLFGLVDDRLIGVAVRREDSDVGPASVKRFAEAAALMRAGWSVNGVGLLTEAFVGVGPAEDVDDPAAAFAAGNPDVHECLLAIAAADDGEALVCALPFRYALGRRIVWQPPLQATNAPPRDAVAILDVFDRALTGATVPMPPDTEAAVQAIAEIIAEAGFAVQTFADVEIV